MDILVFGAGYVGLSLACALSNEHKVKVIDIDSNRIDLINKGISPIYDPLMKDYINKVKGVNHFGNDDHFDLAFIAVPTNFIEEKGYFDLDNLINCLDKCKEHNINKVVIRSTISYGDSRKLANRYPMLDIVYAPEFLKEGEAIFDILNPTRIVIGEKDKNSNLAKEVMDILSRLAKNHPNKYICSYEEAESIKLFSNSYLAMRIAFFNELDSFCMEKGIPSSLIIKGLSDDPRIGKGYNSPSFGYGGYCLPKDSKQLLTSFEGIPQTLIKAIVDSNETRKNYLSSKINKELEELDNPIVGVYGISSKKGGTNYKSSPMEDIIKNIKEAGRVVIIYDPNIQIEEVYGCKVIKNLDEFISKIDYLVLNDFSSSNLNIDKPTFKISR